MGNNLSNYTEIPELFEWNDAYVEFRFEDDETDKLRIYSEFQLSKSDDIYYVLIPDKVKIRLMDGEYGIANVYARSDKLLGKIKFRSRYWRNYEMEYHPQYYRDYIPPRQKIKGFFYKIRHSVSNYPDSVFFYKR